MKYRLMIKQEKNQYININENVHTRKRNNDNNKKQSGSLRKYAKEKIDKRITKEGNLWEY